MLKTYLYIPEQLEDKIILTAKAQNKSKAEVIRQALANGLTSISHQRKVSSQVLFKLAEIGEKYQPKGPRDLSANLDKYFI